VGITILNPPLPRAAAGMDALPYEILVNILSNLCLHCQHSLEHEEVPDFASDEARINQKTLASACRASSVLRHVAQPILFHYYATGNLPKRDLNGDWLATPSQDDKLCYFLRSLVERPNLVDNVKSLSLVTSGVVNGFKRIASETLADAGSKLGIPRMGQHTLESTEEGLDPAKVSLIWDFPPPFNRWAHFWMQELAIALTTRLEQLILARDHPLEFKGLKIAGVSLPYLRSLMLQPRESDFYIFEAAPLLELAPNLHTLYGTSCGGYSLESIGRTLGEKGFPLTNLRKLSVDTVESPALETLLSATPKLEDFEYHIIPLRLTHTLATDATFAPVQPTLRRLCFSISDACAWGECSHADPLIYENPHMHFENHIQPGSTGYRKLQLRDFTSLEVLETDHVLLQAPSDTSTSDTLTSLLPESIKVLHIGCTYDLPKLSVGLIGLARAVTAGSFPQLRAVIVDSISQTDGAEEGPIRDAFHSGSVEISFGQTPGGCRYRGMLPIRSINNLVESKPMTRYYSGLVF
jgi:hypothetical protein